MAAPIGLALLLAFSVALLRDDTYAAAQQQQQAPGSSNLQLSNEQVVALSMQKYKLRKLQDSRQQCELFLEKTREIIAGNGADTTDKLKMLRQLSRALETRRSSGGLISYLSSCAKQLERQRADTVDSNTFDEPDVDRRAIVVEGEPMSNELETPLEAPTEAAAAAAHEQPVRPEVVAPRAESSVHKELEEAKRSIDLHEKQIELLERRLEEAERLNSKLQYQLGSSTSANKDTCDLLRRKETECQKWLSQVENKLDSAKIKLDSVVRERDELQMAKGRLAESTRFVSGAFDKCTSERDALQKERDQCLAELESSRSSSIETVPVSYAKQYSAHPLINLEDQSHAGDSNHADRFEVPIKLPARHYKQHRGPHDHIHAQHYGRFHY